MRLIRWSDRLVTVKPVISRWLKSLLEILGSHTGHCGIHQCRLCVRVKLYIMGILLLIPLFALYYFGLEWHLIWSNRLYNAQMGYQRGCILLLKLCNKTVRKKGQYVPAKAVSNATSWGSWPMDGAYSQATLIWMSQVVTFTTCNFSFEDMCFMVRPALV